MATVSENLNIIANVKGEIREMVGASDHLQSYPNAIANAMTDEPMDGEWSGVRPVADGASIMDGVAFLARLKGKTVGGANSKPEAIVSKGQKIVQLIPANVNGKSTHGVTFSQVDGVFTSSGVRTEKGECITSRFGYSTAGHQYLFVGGNGNLAVQMYASDGTTFVTNNKIATPPTQRQMYLQVNQPNTVGTDCNFTCRPMLFDLTEMFGEGNEPTSADEFAQRLGYASVDVLPFFPYGTEGTEIGRLDIVLPSLFADGLASAGDIYDEIDYLHNVAIKRVGVAEPIVEPIDAKAWYKVVAGGSEEAVCGNGVPLVAEIAYRKDWSEMENDYELAKTLI